MSFGAFPFNGDKAINHVLLAPVAESTRIVRTLFLAADYGSMFLVIQRPLPLLEGRFMPTNLGFSVEECGLRLEAARQGLQYQKRIPSDLLKFPRGSSTDYTLLN